MSGNSKLGHSGIPQPIKHRSSGNVGSPRDEEQTKIRRELTEYGINISNVQLQNDRLHAIFQSVTTIDLPSLTQRLDTIESQVKLLYDLTTTKLEAMISAATSDLRQQFCRRFPSLEKGPLLSRDGNYLRRSESFESDVSIRSYNSFTFSNPPSTLRDEVSMKTMDSDDCSPCVSIVDDDWDAGDTRSVVTALSVDNFDEDAVDYRESVLNKRNLMGNMPENGDASRCFLGKKMGDFCEKSIFEGLPKDQHHQRSASGDDATMVQSSNGDSGKESNAGSTFKVKVRSGSSETFRRMLDALQVLRNGTKIERNGQTY